MTRASDYDRIMSYLDRGKTPPLELLCPKPRDPRLRAVVEMIGEAKDAVLVGDEFEARRLLLEALEYLLGEEVAA